MNFLVLASLPLFKNTEYRRKRNLVVNVVYRIPRTGVAKVPALSPFTSLIWYLLSALLTRRSSYKENCHGLRAKILKSETDFLIIRLPAQLHVMAEKSLCMTYFIWLFFGWLGLHHFYLGRDRHAFVWWSSLGGFFYLGWIRDAWRIPTYVDDANEEPEYMEILLHRMKIRNEPPFSTTRFAGEMLIGYFYGLLVKLALPEETPQSLAAVLICLGIAIGVHLVGNIGREQGQLLMPLLATYGCYILLSWLTEQEASYMYCALAASCTFNYYRQYRRAKSRKTFAKRVVTLGLGGLIICSLWSSFLYFNATITTEDGEKIRLRDSVNHFFKSPAWLEFKQTFWTLYEEANRQGWRNIWDEVIKAFDPTGEANAYKVLDIEKGATEEQIRRKYKKLAVKWHPDRHKGDSKEEAQAKFIEIQQAYEILTSRKRSSNFREETKTEF